MKVYNNLTYTPIDLDDNSPPKQIGIWGQRHAIYLRDFYPELYYTMLSKNELAEYLEGVNIKADKMYLELIKTYDKKEATNQVYDDLIMKLPKELEAKKYEIII